MKQITIDYDLYKKELAAASLNGAKLSKSLVGELQDYLKIMDQAKTYDEVYTAKRGILNLINQISNVET